jgi:hypothetical protein
MYIMNPKNTESSLTAPEDRTSTIENPWRPSISSPPLTDEQATSALAENNVRSYLSLNFPKVDRVYADPPILDQKYGLISFVPAKGAAPNANGVYGYAKLRGSYATDIETNSRAEHLIRNVDSYHKIFTCYVGRPFPLTVESTYSADVNEIDIKKHMAESVSADIKSKKELEKREMADIKERERELMDTSKKVQDGVYEEDPFDVYTTLKVKKAQLTWTYTEHTKKLAEIVDILVNTRKELDDLDEANPDFKDKYFDKYKEARRSSGFKDDPKTAEENFMKYMVEDLSIPEVDELFRKKFAKTV